MNPRDDGSDVSTILVADDDEDIRNLVAWKLEQSGHQISLAVTGDDALQKALAEIFDMVILDWSMPGRTGVEVCGELRDREEYRVTPILLLTAHVSEGHIQQAMSSGATEHIAKPFSPRELADRVNRALGQPGG